MKPKKQKITSVDNDVEKLEPLCTACGNIKCAATVENGMVVPKILNIELPYDLAIPLLGINLKELKAGT